MADTNSRINLAVIGCGARGVEHVKRLKELAEKKEANVAVTAVCDIYTPRKEQAKELTGGALFHDYQELLARDDIDGVVIAAPDHWHAQMCLDAMEAGKDVYCESPMTLTWEEAMKVRQAVDRTQRVLQVGATVCSDPRWATAHELIQKKQLGTIVWSQASITRNSEEGEGNVKVDAAATPKEIDWDRFIGPASWRPFDLERFFRHQKYYDYSLGTLNDDSRCGLYGLQMALGPEFPQRVVAAGGQWVHHDRELPDTFHIIINYATEHTTVLASCAVNESGLPTVIRGKAMTLHLDGDSIKVAPEKAYTDELDPIDIPVKTPKDLQKAHHMDFLDCIRTRKRPNCHVDLACKVTVTLALAVKAFRENEVVFFDPGKEAPVG
ncbi:MAG: Gfo/Idh/MocA family oxidoreductase [Planctomycetota bacterium]